MCFNSCSTVPTKSDLKFSNTQSWDKYFLVYRNEKFKTFAELEHITLPPPPSNTSAQTDEELLVLLTYQKNRTLVDINFINNSIEFQTQVFNKLLLSDLILKFKETHLIFQMIHNDMSVLIAKQKETFDRVRPEYLSHKIRPSINTPAHPSYPSGHASMSYIYAEIFSMIDPENKEIYLKSAYRISVGREIAGVHYPSDTEAGKALADQFTAIIIKNNDFLQQLNKAKIEFKKINQTF